MGIKYIRVKNSGPWWPFILAYVTIIFFGMCIVYWAKVGANYFFLSTSFKKHFIIT